MKKILLLLLTFPFIAFTQSSMNMNLLGTYEYPTTNGNDIWGWVDASENEFAIVGLRDGVSCVNVTNPTAPVEEFFIPDIYSIWRDIKTFGNYAYVTTESDAGLLIIDLTDMTGNTFWHVKDFMNPITGLSLHWESAHDLFIDENGICYIFGAGNPAGWPQVPTGAIFLDVATNPTSPTHLGQWNEQYIHDGMARGDTMYVGCIYDGSVHIVDVSDKANPSTLGSAYTPDLFTHNAWVSDDGNYVFTTDEKPDGYLGAFDISDLNNIQEIDRIQSNPGLNTIPHNTFVDGNFLITSYYCDGTTVHDITHPNYMIEVAYYDSYIGTGPSYNGCWGTYPYLPSGNIISSDINSSSTGQGRLLIYGRAFQQACYLQGTITDCASNQPISNANIEILNTNTTESSNLIGSYQTAVVDSALYQIVYSASGYENDTITAILDNGVMLTQDVALSTPCAIPINNLNISICIGDIFAVGNNTYTSTGNYTDVIIDVCNCDSVVNTNLTVNPVYSYSQNIDICQGNVFVVGQSVYNTSGAYYDTLSSSTMCDSVIVTYLNVAELFGIMSGNLPYLTVVANGGTQPYTYIVTGPNGFNQQINSVVGTQNVAPTYNGQYQFIATDANGCESIPVFFEVSFPLSVDDFHENREVVKITDLLGREVKVDEVVDKTTLLYNYSDGIVEKKIVIE